VLSFIWRIDLEFSSNCSMARIVKCFRPCLAWLGLGLGLGLQLATGLGVGLALGLELRLWVERTTP